MTREDLESMRRIVLSNRAATEASTERLQRMLRENAEDMQRHAMMLRLIEDELKRMSQPQREV